jgi:chemotaxis protein histidine kinase CheA
MFMDELDERSARLVEGARAMRSGPLDSDYAGAMMREGHTIKGTARVLGFEAVSVGGLLVEEIWRRIQHNELEPSEQLALALESLAETVVGAGDADPDTGTVEHYEAVTRLSSVVPDIDLPAMTPPDPTAVVVEARLPVEVEPEPAADHPAAEEEPHQEETSLAPVAATATGEARSPAQVPDASPAPDLEANPAPPSARGPGGDFPAGAMAAVRRLRGYSDTPEETQRVALRPEPHPVAPVPVPSAPAAAPAPAPPAPTARQPAGPISRALAEASDPDRLASRSSDVDYLVESVGRWTTESSMVNAGSLNRLVNGLSETRSQVDVLANLVGQLEAGIGDGVGADTAGHLGRVSAWLQQTTGAMLDESLGLAAVPVTNITNTLPQLVRMMSDKLGKGVAFEVVGDEDITVDRQILEQLSEPIRQVIVNALTHGIEIPQARRAARKSEEASLKMRFGVLEGTLEIEIADDGAGIDWDGIRRVAVAKGLTDEVTLTDEALERMVFADGVSAGAEGTSTGSGHGLAVVSDMVEALFGRVRVTSEPGVGTTVTISVPSARALEKLLLIDTAGGLWAVPSAAVEAVQPIGDAEIIDEGDAREIVWDGSRIPLRSLSAIAGVAPARGDRELLVVSHRSGRAAFTFGSARGTYELWVRHLAASHAAPRHIFGMSFLTNGEAVLVLDAGRLVERASSLPDEDHRREVRVLVVDDSRGARAVISGALAAAGLTPSVAGSVAEALEVLDEHEVDALVVDFSMPNADGVALVKEVRARQNRMPIVMLSAVANEEDQTRAKRAGVDAFFDKSSFQEGVIADTLLQMLDA